MRGVVLGYFVSVGFATLMLGAIALAASGAPATYEQVLQTLTFLLLIYIFGLAICGVPFALLRLICWRAGVDSLSAALLSGAGVGLCAATVITVIFSTNGIDTILLLLLVLAAIGAASGLIQWLIEESFRQHGLGSEKSGIQKLGKG